MALYASGWMDPALYASGPEDLQGIRPYGLLWPSMAFYGPLWPSMAFYGLLWPSMA